MSQLNDFDCDAEHSAPPPLASAGLPLVTGDLDRILAVRSGGPVTVAAFMSEASALAARLPDVPYIINLCASRYRFAVGLVAAMLRGQITLLPANRAPKALDCVADLYSGTYRLTDEFPAAHEAPESRRWTDFTVPADRVIAIVFTSGSTGDPQPHQKNWGIFSTSARLIGQNLGISSNGPQTLIATVPPQHMYGLELSVLLPLCWGGRLHDGKPFFPADVAEALASVGAPRFLVTTPVHLRACVESTVYFPAIEGLVSATAPLSTELASAAEERFGCSVQEIYGCSEAGSVACRRTVEGELWRPFAGVEIGGHGIRADFLPMEVPIQDVVEDAGDGKFRLLGRQTDLINIAGKRTSLGALNHTLLEISGVMDGVFFQPDENQGVQSRLAAAVVAPGIGREFIQTELASRIDAVFLPRPLYLVERLPRSETGKLTHQALAAMVAELRGVG